MQIGHSGRKGSTKRMWEGMDRQLDADNWEVIAPSALAYGPVNQVPRQIDRATMDWVRDEFVAATRRAAEAGFDLAELHAAHGYLISSFLSPVSNQRTDEYGGSLENRLRYPLEVFDAMRAAWPAERPLTVRLSAVDWIEGGNTIDEAVEIARAFIEHGADGIDVSSGQISKDERPQFGRSYQTPFADAIRNRVAAAAGVTVIAVGAVSSYDDVNSILLAGRADMVALGRTHLWDPQWTLHAAADQGYRGAGADWVDPFRAGSRKPPSARTDAVRPRLSLVRDAQGGVEATAHRRWTAGADRDPRALRRDTTRRRTQERTDMTRQIINPPALIKPSGFAHGVRAGEFVYLGGQTAMDATGAIVPGGIVEQFAQAFSNVLTTLDAAAWASRRPRRCHDLPHRCRGLPAQRP